MVDRLIERIELAALNSLAANYPCHSMIERFLITKGALLIATKEKRDAYSGFLQEKPSLRRFVAMQFFVSEHSAYDAWIARTKAEAYRYFEICYFDDLRREALPYFTALYFPRYLWATFSRALRGILRWRPKGQGRVLNDYELDFLVMATADDRTGNT